jgi:hypothetical protein
MSWTRRFLVWALLAVAPLGGVRVVCVVEPHAAAASLSADDPLACQTICSKHPRASYRTRCALVEDPTCAFALGSATAVLPDAPELPFTMTSEPHERAVRIAFDRPALEHASPPPKPPASC